MALSAYRIQFQKQGLSFNPGEVGWFDAVTAARLVAAGLGVALDALPATVPPPAPGASLVAFLGDAGLPTPTSAADSQILAAEAGLLAST